MTRISAVLPCYNAAPFLEEAIESVRAQHRPVDEIIVVDDRSTDDSVAVARRLGATVVELTRNSGPAAARNAGVRAASGAYVAWLDADDYWVPEHVARVAALLDQDERVAVAFGLVRQFGARTETWPALLPEHAPVDAWETSLRRCVLPHNAVIVRRDAVLDVGGYDERLRLAEDYDLWMRLAWRHPFVCTHAVTAMWRRHASNTSGDPIEYWRSEYRARGRFVDAVSSGAMPPRGWGRSYAPADVRAAAVAVWEHNLTAAWHSRAPEHLAFHLAMAPMVDGSKWMARRWQLRRRLLWAATLRDSLRDARGPTTHATPEA
jgi:glycosyltransferase involved in cell wall biosynthesis